MSLWHTQTRQNASVPLTVVEKRGFQQGHPPYYAELRKVAPAEIPSGCAAIKRKRNSFQIALTGLASF